MIIFRQTVKKKLPYPMRVKYIFLLVLLFALFLGSCRKTNHSATASPVVYVAGYTGPSNGFKQAAYWKNGTLVLLPGGTDQSMANAITVVGNDVYVSGMLIMASGNYAAVYWKNGALTMLGDSTTCCSTTTGICVDGSDNVYVSGGDSASPHVYWKNGAVVDLPSLGPELYENGTAGIAVSGNDVYVCGISYDPADSSQKAVYWKNGNLVNLTPSRDESAEASAIAVQGNDVYVAGTVPLSPAFLGQTAVYWKNGAQVNLTDNLITGYATGIALENGNAYVSGEGGQVQNALSAPGANSLFCWKNGALYNPSAGSFGASNIVMGDIAVSGSQAYAALTYSGEPYCWEVNDSLIQLSGGAGMAQGIAVVSP
jgi:hypothetical protein